MQRVTGIRHCGDWDAAAAVDRVVLDAGDRQRRRIVLTGERGTEFLLDFERPVTLRDGDGLVLDDGAMVLVAGQPEALIEVSAHSALDTVRLAWHLGNRHTDVQIVGGKSASAAIMCWRRCCAAWARISRRSRRRSIRSKARRMVTGTSMARKRRSASLRSKNACRAPPHPRARGEVEERRGFSEVGRVRGPHRDSEPAETPPNPARSARPLAARAGRGKAPALYRLMAWLSPAFPVGAFSYSGGIEWAVEAGDIKDAETLRAWLAVMLADGGGFCDAVSVRARPPRRRRRRKPCARWPSSRRLRAHQRSAIWKPPRRATPFSKPRARPGRARRSTGLKRLGMAPVAYPVAVAVAASRPRHCARTRARRLSAGGRRQFGVGRRAAHPARADRRPARARRARAVVAATAQRALHGPLDDLGCAAFRADLASARHETQYTRLFRS